MLLSFGISIVSQSYGRSNTDSSSTLLNAVMIAMIVLLLGSLFVSQESAKTIWDCQVYLCFAAIGLNIVYFFYAQYEGKQFTSCTSCQIGNIIGTTAISLIYLSVIMLLSYFII